MIHTNLPIFLASRSPRRHKLLKQLNLKFRTLNINLDENLLDGEHPVKTVKRLALLKLIEAEKLVKDGIVITADTIVVFNKKIIGKPIDRKHAEKILNLLSGKTHFVYTGYAVKNVRKNETIIDFEKTSVTFNKLNRQEIKDYIATGSPMDKAGAYGIQDDFGGVFVKKINGCYYNVVGLPIAKLYKSLLEIL